MTDLRPPGSQVAFVVYLQATGAIRWQGRCAVRDLALQDVAVGEALLEADLPFGASYVDVGGPAPIGRPRPSFPAFDKLAIKADGQDAAVLELPIAATVVLDGVAHDVPAGPLRIAVDSPGHYSVELQGWPYMPARCVVEAS